MPEPPISEAERRRRGLEANKDNFFKQGLLLSERGEAAAAVAELEKVNEVDPDYPGLQEALGRLRAQGEKETAALKRRWAAEEEKRLREEGAAREAAAADKRRAYADTLRTLFLDQGLDIKVRSSGRNAERLELRFVLFNDVWTHRFQKDGMVEQWQGLGFERVDVKDGYDYHRYWTFR